MSERELLERAIAHPGQSQDDRSPVELAGDFVVVDERDTADLLRFTTDLAKMLRHRQPGGGEGDWRSFFPPPDDPATWQAHAADAPHLALLLAFCELYRAPQTALNRFTARHLDFYYRRVLRFASRPARPDRAHVVIELKRHAAPFALGPAHRLSAGKDAANLELLYAPVRETAIGPARVASLHSIFVDPAGRGTVRSAPIADSADGAGAPFANGEPDWPPFGSTALEPGPVGFAIAAPVLRLREGERTILVTLALDSGGRPLDAGAIAASLDCSLTGEKGWLPCEPPTGSLVGDRLTLRLGLSASAGAVVDFDAERHGYRFAAEAPVLLATLRPDGPLGYDDLRVLRVRSVRIAVEVTDVVGLTLENDHGRLDPRTVFLPFGPHPRAGSRFMVGCPEAFAKALSNLTLRLVWHGISGSIARHYAAPPTKRNDTVAGYTVPDDDDAFAVVASWRDVHAPKSANALPLFRRGDAQAMQTLNLGAATSAPAEPRGRWAQPYVMRSSGTAWGRQQFIALRLRDPSVGAAIAPPAARAGFLTLALTRDFLHDAYRRQVIAHPAIAWPEPYTPALREIRLDYAAADPELDLAGTSLDAFSGALRFFQVGCFGQRRDHAYLRAQRTGLDPGVGLLPEHPFRGELLIGLRDLRPGDAVSLLFQVVDGSADPDAAREPIVWSVLSDNHWQALAPAEIDLDATDGLLTSGIVRVVVPAAATIDNTLLPADLLWLRAAVAGNAGAVCRLRAVAANAVEVVSCDARVDGAQIGRTLPPGRLTRLKTPIAAVKSVAQPFASFGGAAAEGEAARNTRAAERLRHRDRCLTAWDYERIVLDAFPSVHTVNCIAHAGPGGWRKSGHVLLVVVPDLRGRRAVDALRPKVDLHTLQRIREHVAARAGMDVTVHVANPRYQTVTADFRVRFRPGCDRNFFRNRLQAELIAYLSPWAAEREPGPSFGGRIHRSTLLDFVEQRDFVDFVTDFRLTTDAAPGRDVAIAVAERPDTILVSAARHQIEVLV